MANKPSQPFFNWTGVNRDGDNVNGLLAARDSDDVRRQLARKGITTLSTERVVQPRQWRRAGLRDVALFSRQLSALIGANVPVVTALTTLANGGALPKLKNTLAQLHDSVSSGTSLSEALQQHPKLFDALYVSLVASGENSGQLGTTLQQLANYLEQQVALRAQLKAALTYPAIVMIVAISITIVMLMTIVPIFGEMFNNFGADLPFYTRALMQTSSWLQNNGLWLLLVMILGAVALVILHRHSVTMQAWLSRRILNIPGLGLAIEQAALARYTSTVATLYQGGVPLPDTLELAAQATGNAWYKQQLGHAAKATRAGASLSNALAQHAKFDATTIEMTRIGEDTGRLTALYEHLSEFYQQESKLRIESGRRLVEPLLILIVGGLVGIIVLALYLPIITLVTTV